MRKLTNQLRLAQELLFQVFAETVDEGFEGHHAANDIVPRPFDAARGSRPDRLEGFVAAFLQCNHLGVAQESPGAVALPAIAARVSLRRGTGKRSVPRERVEFLRKRFAVGVAARRILY